ncbi:MAG: PD-(D/E)XK nuclease family protein [Flavobacteriales bacterium]|nr:PD-(D/E)XK nuclease family protein [Flavobacteriales bacterium]
METKPSTNLFDYATSELSQDAFFAWLCAHADTLHRDTEVHEIARAFIRWLYESSSAKTPPYEHVEVIQQHLKIDLLLRLHGAGNTDHYLLIEDKTYTSDYGTQISGYLDALTKEHRRAEQIWKIERDSILPIYIKTWVEGTRQAEGAGLKARRLYLPDITKFFSKERLVGVKSEILTSWCEVRRNGHDALLRYESKPMQEWNRTQWYGCFHDVCAALPSTQDPHYNEVPNAQGGFLAFTIGWPQTSDGYYTYVQVAGASKHEPFISLRLGANNGSAVPITKIREMFDKANRAAKRHGISVQKPKRLSPGSSSRFATIAPSRPWSDWCDDNGIFAMTQATGNLQRIMTFLTDCTTTN